MIFKGIIIFADDILVYSKTVEENCEFLKNVMKRLKQYEFRVAANKVVLVASTVTYLGMVLTKEGTKPCPAKTAAIDAMAPPKNLRELQSALGSFNFYKRFI